MIGCAFACCLSADSSSSCYFNVLNTYLCTAALNSAGMVRLLGSTGQASETGDFPENSLQGSIFGILCKQSKAGSHLLNELSALLAAWHVTELWLPGNDGHSQRLHATQAHSTSHTLLHHQLQMNACLCSLLLPPADQCLLLPVAASLNSSMFPAVETLEQIVKTWLTITKRGLVANKTNHSCQLRQ